MKVTELGEQAVPRERGRQLPLLRAGGGRGGACVGGAPGPPPRPPACPCGSASLRGGGVCGLDAARPRGCVRGVCGLVPAASCSEHSFTGMK